MAFHAEYNLGAGAGSVFDAVVIQNRHRLEAATTSQELSLIAEEVRHLLPADLREEIDAYSDGKSHVLILKGSKVVPIGDVPATPEDKPTEDDISPLLFQATLALMNGLVRSAPLRNSDGRMQINHVIPKAPKAEFQVCSTAVDLDFHIDGMRRRRVPASIGLYCIRPQSGANTYFISVDSVLEKLDPEVVRVLKTPMFSFDNEFDNVLANGSAFGTRHAQMIDVPYAMIDNGQLRYSQNSVGLNAEAQAALDVFKQAIAEEERFVASLDAGDVLLFRNDRLLHGRSTFPFEENPDRRRWVLRQTSDFYPVY